MATYFPTSNNQRDTAAMLYLREPLPNSYSETPNLSANMMMMYMNYPPSSTPYTDTLSSANFHQQNNSIDTPPLEHSNSSASQQRFLSNLEETQIRDQDFNAWRDNNRNDMLLMQPMGEPGPTSILENSQNLQGQGLSLSLSPQIPSGIEIPSLQYRNPNSGFSSLLSPNSSASGKAGDGSIGDNENSQNKQPRNEECMKFDASQFGLSSFSRTIPGSKYLKAAQQLLNEVVNVHKATKQHEPKKELRKDSKETENSVPSNLQEPTSNSTAGLSAAEKQDLQNKMTKLLAMLDEVDRRYRQYYHQMQIVVSSLDVIAGCGSAMPYTALALQTISRHFRCLCDAINGQIHSTQQNLGGEQDGSANSKGVGISRLRYVDQQLGQQRALHHLGVMPQHTWRPQRGLPESSVTILRAWLFEHFLHPYPKDSDKIMLARQTGLTRSQVSNWFINARVRLWKPMVEEMYKEEAGDAEMDSNSSSEVSPKPANGEIKAYEERGENLRQRTTSTANDQYTAGECVEQKFDHSCDEEMMGPGTYLNFQNVTPVETRSHYETIVQSNESGGRFITDADAAYHMSELARFGNGSSVSLTLGLQHCEDGSSVPMPLGSHHSHVTVKGNAVYGAPATSSVGPDGADFDCMDTGNRQQRFGSPHLLHDFVA